MWSILGLAALLVAPSNALYFYLHAGEEKCFIEELPKDTLVVGHYKGLQWNANQDAYTSNPEGLPTMGMHIRVEEVFDRDHQVISQTGSSTGKFTFTAADAGEHRICLTPTNVPGNTGWLFSGRRVGGIKLGLQLAIGQTSAIESSDKSKLSEVAQRAKDLNARLQDIRREQMFQREREAEFRDQSESVNTRVVRWTMIQCVVLGVTCAWQLSYLRAFFIKQKLT
ncbi:transmembrane emp24 domain-containing protein 9 [Zymoseptoria brevis]|uniref:Transmembrane emp24 domain-containing protein 9 n=1 Tax=Zymoseptoria brevis TaxID=1047168 RepID=A0A0F4GNE0_9PEZI|nr:transmembrane emp24 domain-containing protein 9 [Zymoseptoria brevis]